MSDYEYKSVMDEIDKKDSNQRLPNDYGWSSLSKQIKIGDIINAPISKITKFGFFVNLKGGIQGLIHISEVSEKPIQNINDFLKIGQRVDVKVIQFDAKKKRIGLSLKVVNNTSNISNTFTGGAEEDIEIQESIKFLESLYKLRDMERVQDETNKMKEKGFTKEQIAYILKKSFNNYIHKRIGKTKKSNIRNIKIISNIKILIITFIIIFFIFFIGYIIYLRF